MTEEKNYGDPKSTRSYQCFMGKWEGLCKTFDDKGNFLEASAVHMDVYWVDENTWHLHEDFEKLYGGMWDLVVDPVEHAHKMIAHIDRKRKDLGIDKARDRILVDMADRRAMETM